MFSITRFRCFSGFVLLISCCAAQAQDIQQITLSPNRDTTLFEEGALSNGGGQYLFAGVVLSGAQRRALLRFPVAAIPAGATVTDATVSMNLSRSRTPNTALTVSLHRMTADWQAGLVDASGQEGAGASAQNGDATWAFRSFPDQPWLQPGGDFVASSSASLLTVALGGYQWQSSGLITDVQQWIDSPASNFGWIAIGSAGAGNAKRFDSAEIGDNNLQPQLTISYLPAPPQSAPEGIPTLSPWALVALIAALMTIATAARAPRPR